MTFDEALNKLNQECFWSTGFPEIKEIEFEKVKEVFEQLREEYAPTIEMTKEQYEFVARLLKESKELGSTFDAFCAVYKYFVTLKRGDLPFKFHEEAMVAWLHPETIKVVDE